MGSQLARRGYQSCRNQTNGDDGAHIYKIVPATRYQRHRVTLTPKTRILSPADTVVEALGTYSLVQGEAEIMLKRDKEASVESAIAKMWDLRQMKSRLDWSTVLYLFYVFCMLATGVYLLS